MKIQYFNSTMIALLSIMIACSSKTNKSEKVYNVGNNQIDEECVALNDSAVKILNRYYLDESDPGKLDKILSLLDSAIICDTNYYLAYNNKLTVLNLKGDYLEVINLLNTMLEFSNNDPQLVFFKGIAFEKLNDYSSAEKEYKQAALGYKKLLELYPDSLGLITDNLFFTAFTEGKDQALAQLKEQILKHPESTILKEIQPVFENFDRNDFMPQMGKR